MVDDKADVARWARGQRLAAERIARESARDEVPLSEALERVDDLRRWADSWGAVADHGSAERENLAYHLVWAQVRRAYGVG